MNRFQRAVVWVLGGLFISGVFTVGWASAWIGWTVDAFLGNMAASLGVFAAVGLWARYIFPFFMRIDVYADDEDGEWEYDDEGDLEEEEEEEEEDFGRQLPLPLPRPRR